MGSEAEAYRRVAKACRDQILDVEWSGWGFFDKRCAVLNLRGVAALCDAWAENAETEEASREG